MPGFVLLVCFRCSTTQVRLPCVSRAHSERQSESLLDFFVLAVVSLRAIFAIIISNHYHHQAKPMFSLFILSTNQRLSLYGTCSPRGVFNAAQR